MLTQRVAKLANDEPEQVARIVRGWMAEEEVRWRSRSGTDDGARKAAIALVALGEEGAAAILKYLSEHEIERIAREIAGLGTVPPDVGEQVLIELNSSAVRRASGARWRRPGASHSHASHWAPINRVASSIASSSR